jgi:hypothetical protein
MPISPVRAIGPDKDDPAAAAREFKVGKALYDQKKYREAFPHLTKAAQAYTKDTVIQYYWGLGAAQIGDVQTIKRAMSRIVIRNRPSSGNAKQAHAMLARYASGCQPYCCANAANQSVRFKKADLPIKIFITDGYMLPPPYRGREAFNPTEMQKIIQILRAGDALRGQLERDPNYSSSVRGSVAQGLQKWGWAQGEGLFTFQQVNSFADCDIIVFWNPGKRMAGGNGAYTSSMNCGGAGKKVVMQVSSVNPNEHAEPGDFENYLTWIGTHEFGHAFGLCGHSPNPDDIMYKVHEWGSGAPSVSENDRNTMRALYDIAPDVGM